MIGYIPVYKKLIAVTLVLSLLLACSMLLGLAVGSSGDASAAWKLLFGQGEPDPTLEVIVWQLRWPRVILAATVGASLSLGGLVFQALLRNPLAEPYILGVSGGSAVGAILGILAGEQALRLGLHVEVGAVRVAARVLVAGKMADDVGAGELRPYSRKSRKLANGWTMRIWKMVSGSASWIKAS